MHFRYGRPAAVARIRGGAAYPLVRGTVLFYQLPSGVLIQADISGLPDNNVGFYGFHIHIGSTCSGENFSDTGMHYAKSFAVHPGHAGDLPNLLSDNGDAYMTVLTKRFSIADVLNRTVVIHNGADDFRTQPSGDSGNKIACGVIQRR